MASADASRRGNVGAMLAATRHLSLPPRPEAEMNRRQRTLLANFCRMLADDVNELKPASPVQGTTTAAGRKPPSAPRLRQILDLLLAGDAEKQIAARLSLSRHTVHQYVKAVYKHFDVTSRAELLAIWVKR